MKVSREWQVHSQHLRRIANAIRIRPTLASDDHISKLMELANDLEDEAKIYAEEEEGPELA